MIGFIRRAIKYPALEKAHDIWLETSASLYLVSKLEKIRDELIRNATNNNMQDSISLNSLDVLKGMKMVLVEELNISDSEMKSLSQPTACGAYLANGTRNKMILTGKLGNPDAEQDIIHALTLPRG